MFLSRYIISNINEWNELKISTAPDNNKSWLLAGRDDDVCHQAARHVWASIR